MDDKKKAHKNTKDIQDFEMGSEENESNNESPKINRQAEAKAEGKVEGHQFHVNPSAAAPAKRQNKARKIDPVARRKALIAFFGVFGSILIIFLVLAFIFIATSGVEQSPIARLLSVNQASFINGLIAFIHVIFIIIALVTFTFTMVGLFKASMAKKDDKVARKAGLRMMLVSGSTLIVVLLVWGFTFIYLESKKVATPEDIGDPITTIPEDPINLSAPVEILFDSAGVRFNKKTHRIISHNWDFGDGGTSTSQKTSHVFDTKGTYTVILTVIGQDKTTGELNEIGTYSEIIAITNQALQAIFVADKQSGSAPLTVEFDASDSADPDGYIDTYEWDMDGDGSYDDAVGETAEYTYDKIGKYRVSLRVTSTTDEFSIAEKEINVQEMEELDAVIEVLDEPEAFEVGTSYVFQADESTSPNGNIEEYEWDFGDGSDIAEGRTTSHVFESIGRYQVELTITDEEGDKGSTTKLIELGAEKGAPQAAITTQPALGDSITLEGIVPFPVLFDARASTDPDSNIVDYEWDLGDGNTGFGETISHTFSDTGTYTVLLTVTDADDNESRSSLIVKVTAQNIIAALDSDKIEGTAPLTINFDASGSTYKDGTITSYKWDFGDGTPEKLDNAKISHRFTSIGNYTTKVTVIGDDNTSASTEIHITVREIPLKACFTSVFSEGEAPLTNSFNSSCSTGAVTDSLWSFGDGATATEKNPTHVFTEPGEYTIKLEVADSDNTVDTFEQTLTVTAP